MSLLTPLGLLGLIGLIILIIIYIIKPNFQSKFVSSTFIWRLSLKYKKKKIPISKLRNILLFICQVLILSAAAFVLAQPFIDDGADAKETEVILIVDGSASMKSESTNDLDDCKTRIERALVMALEEAQIAIEEGNKVSLILAAEKSSFLLQQVESKDSNIILSTFEELLQNPLALTCNSTPDVKGAMALAEQITSITPNAKVTMYTDTTYLNTGDITVQDVKSSEYNVAILDVRASVVENYYRFEIDVACYGADMRVTVNCDVIDANGTGRESNLSADVLCTDDAVQTIVFAKITDDMPLIEQEMISEDIDIFSYDTLHVTVDEKDCVKTDNEFYLYGGLKPTLKIQYYSTLPNIFYTTALFILKDSLADDWNVEIVEVNGEATPATEGFDIYIFEHSAPATVPTDGLVIYTNTANIPNAAGIQLMQIGRAHV